MASRNDRGLCCLPSISAATAGCMFCRKTVHFSAVTSASRHLPWPCLSLLSLSSSIQRPYTHQFNFSLLFDLCRPLAVAFLVAETLLPRFEAILIDCLRAPSCLVDCPPFLLRRACQPRRSTTFPAHHRLQTRFTARRLHPVAVALDRLANATSDLFLLYSMIV